MYSYIYTCLKNINRVDSGVHFSTETKFKILKYALMYDKNKKYTSTSLITFNTLTLVNIKKLLFHKIFNL